MKLADILEMKEFKYRKVITVKPNENVSDAVKKLIEYDRGSLPVCDDKGELVGIVTERDIARCCATQDRCGNIKIQDIMSPEVVVASPDDEVDYAISLMKDRRIRHIPIVSKNKIVGMVSMRDLLISHIYKYDAFV